jgi:hypothetical protein
MVRAALSAPIRLIIQRPRPDLPTKAAGRPRVDLSKLPFDPMDGVAKLRGWEGVEFDRTG